MSLLKRIESARPGTAGRYARAGSARSNLPAPVPGRSAAADAAGVAPG